MTPDPVQLVMFAIRSSIKLGQQVRQAYVDSTKRRELVLPLPNFFALSDLASADAYFANEGAKYLPRVAALAGLIAQHRAGAQPLTREQAAEVMACHLEFQNLDLAEAGRLGTPGASISAAELNALVTVRQWQRGSDPNPSALQRLAGSFIEIGVDYFAHVPGALHRNSRHARVVEGFLGAMARIKFSEAPPGELPGRLFVAALETAAEHPELLSADPKIRELVQVTTRALGADVARRLAAIGDTDLVRSQAVGEWAELVFRSLLSSAGGLVLSDPSRFFGVDEAAQGALVTRVGESVLALVLGDAGVDVARLFSREGLDTVTRAALAVVGEHPEILHTNHAGLQALLASIATELGRFDTLLTPDLLPGVTRLVLEKTGENLALLWPDVAAHPEKHLLISAAQATLAALTRAPSAGERWKARFTRADLLVVVDAVLDEVIDHPAWLLGSAGELNKNLATVLDAALGVLRGRADDRLSPATGVAVLRAVLAKVALRPEFLDKLPAGVGGERVLAAVLDALLGSVFATGLDARAAWQLVRSEAIVALVEIGLAELAKVKIDAAKVAVVASAMKALTDALIQGAAFEPAAFQTTLRQALAA